jgi:RNA polymerase sigma-70 factor, ECF subfamily
MPLRSIEIQRKECDCQVVNYDKQDDEQLVQKWRNGQLEAFNELHRRHWHQACRVASIFLENKQDVLDAVQEAFMKAYINLDKFQGKSSFKTWLSSITRNAALGIARKEKSYQAKKKNSATVRPTDTSKMPIEMLLSKELDEWLKKHVDGKTYLVYELLVKEDWTYREIAEATSTTLSKVRTIITKLIKKAEMYFSS